MAIIQHFREDITVIAVEEEDTDFAAEVFYVVNDFPSPSFPQKEFVFLHIAFFKQGDKGIDHKGIVLGRDAEKLAVGDRIFVSLL